MLNVSKEVNLYLPQSYLGQINLTMACIVLSADMKNTLVPYFSKLLYTDLHYGN